MSRPSSEEIHEIALWISRIQKRFAYKKNQLTEALGRAPSAQEMLDVAGAEINILGQLYESHAKLRHIQLPFFALYPFLSRKLLTRGTDSCRIRLVN